MESSNDTLRVLGDDRRLNEDWEPVSIVLFASLDSIHGEATGKTGDTSKDGFESFGEMMRDEVSAISRRMSSVCLRWERATKMRLTQRLESSLPKIGACLRFESHHKLP